MSHPKAAGLQRARWARARAACRVDFAGGTLDIWPLGLLHSGALTVNTAIDVEVAVELERRSDGYQIEMGGASHRYASLAEVAAVEGGELIAAAATHLELAPCRIRLESGSPRGAGLGASSALMIALLAAGDALEGRKAATVERAARRARDLEARMMGLPTGMQDHFPALLGGALAIEHQVGGETVAHIAVDLEKLGSCLTVAFTGKSHFSAGNNWRVVCRRLDGDPTAIQALERVGEAARRARSALEHERLEELGECMSLDWQARATLAPGVSTPEIEALLEVASHAGSWGGKACGAGGGGCIAVLGPAENRAAIEAALAALGARVLPARPTPLGLRVESGDGPIGAGQVSGDAS